MWREYQDRFEFLAVYIREAHATDGWWFGKGLTKVALRVAIPQAATDVMDPTTSEERRQVAQRCESNLDWGMPTLVDDVDDEVNHAYAAWPTRLYLIGLDGRVVYGGGLGPFDFKPKKLRRAIEGYLAAQP